MQESGHPQKKYRKRGEECSRVPQGQAGPGQVGQWCIEDTDQERTDPREDGRLYGNTHCCSERQKAEAEPEPEPGLGLEACARHLDEDLQQSAGLSERAETSQL